MKKLEIRKRGRSPSGEKEGSKGNSSETFGGDASPREKSPRLPIGTLIGKALLTGRPTISDSNYELALNARFNVAGTANPKPGKLLASHLRIDTRDGVAMSALKIHSNTASNQTIVVFQGQKGNYQTESQLTRLREIADRTGANVIAFNYRDNPGSKSALIHDALAVADYLFNSTDIGGEGREPKNVTFYGDSLGGAVAAETAAQLKNEGKEVKAFLARTPKSLAYAIKNIDLSDIMQSKRAAGLLNSIKNTSPRNLYQRILKNFGGDLNTQAAVNTLKPENIVLIEVKNDKIIGQGAAVTHDQKRTVVCDTYSNTDEHNANLRDLSTNIPKDTKDTSSSSKDALDLLNDLCHSNNPTSTKELGSGKRRAEQQTAKTGDPDLPSAQRKSPPSWTNGSLKETKLRLEADADSGVTNSPSRNGSRS